MQKRRTQFLCILMVIIVCCSEIFLKTYQSNHLLFCAVKESSTGISDAAEEALRIPSGMHQVPGIRRNTKARLLTILLAKLAKSEKTFLDYSLEKIFSKKIGNVYTESDEIYFLKNLQNDLIANYLHKSDGKKRI